MTNFRRQILMKAFMLFDPAILALSYVVAAVRIWHLTESVPSLRLFHAGQGAEYTIVSRTLLFLARHFLGVRTISIQTARGSRTGSFDVLKATAVSAFMLVIAASIFRVQMITLAFIVVFWVMSSLVLILCRLLMREFLAWVRTHGRNLRHVLIVGTNSRALEFATTIESRPELGYQLIGFADEEWTGNSGFEKNGEAIVTGLDHFSEFLRKRIVDEVVIALPMKSFYCQSG